MSRLAEDRTALPAGRASTSSRCGRSRLRGQSTTCSAAARSSSSPTAPIGATSFCSSPWSRSSHRLALWAVVWLAGRLSKTLADGCSRCLVGLFVAIFAAQGLQSLSPPTALHVGMSAGFGILGAALYGFPAVRSFATWLTPAIVVFPLGLPARPCHLADGLAGPRTTRRSPPGHAPPTPIVFVVFDQFPLTSLLAPDGSIDATDLSRIRRARAHVHVVSERDDGRRADDVGAAADPVGPVRGAGQLPTAADYPYNLFTALGQSYKMAVFEPLTGLCPDSICPPSAAVRDAPTLLPMLTDSSVVLAHRVVPRGLAGGLPPVDENWRGFAEAQDFQRQWGRERERDRRRIIDNFLEAITPGNQDATLYFLHALLPHEPYEYLPSGQKSGWNRRTAGITFGRWTNEEWPVAQTYARHLLQVGFRRPQRAAAHPAPAIRGSVRQGADRGHVGPRRRLRARVRA